MDPQLQQIYRRLKTSSVEEKSAIFADLKKTPHLLAAYLKMSQATRSDHHLPEMDVKREANLEPEEVQ